MEDMESDMTNRETAESKLTDAEKDCSLMKLAASGELFIVNEHHYQIEKKTLPLYLGSSDEEDTSEIEVAFMDGITDVPYISVETMKDLISKLLTSYYEEKGGKIFLKTNLYELASSGKIPSKALKCKLMKTEDIPPAFEPEENYENPDGSPITFDTDFFGTKRSSTGGKVLAGPFADAADVKKSLF
jgi:hypothetical protein